MRLEPKAKMMLRDGILSALYEPYSNFMQKELHKIIESNSKWLHSPLMHFLYRGELFYMGSPSDLPRQKNRIHPDMEEKMKVYLEEAHSFNLEKEQVHGFIVQVLNLSDVFEDYLKVLPECIHEACIKSYENCWKGLTFVAADSKDIEHLLRSNQKAINTIKERVALNLII